MCLLTWPCLQRLPHANVSASHPLAPPLCREPARSFARDCYSFCRFDVLWADPGSGCSSSSRRSGSGSHDQAEGGQQQQQQQRQRELEQAEEFVAAALASGEPAAAAQGVADGGPPADAPQQDQQEDTAAGQGASRGEQLPRSGKQPSLAPPADVAAAIWALHPCSQASAARPPALLAIPGGDERTAEVVCAACGAALAQFREQAAGHKLGMLMAVQLFCHAAAAAEGAGSAGDGAVADSATAGGAAAGGVAASGVPAAAAPPPRVWLAAGYEDGSVAVWAVGGQRGAPPLACRQLCSEPVMCVAVDSAGTGGACGSAEEQVVAFKIDWEARRLRQRHAIELRANGQAGVGDVAVRPDRRLLATAGWDGRVRLYKYRSGRPLAVLKVGYGGRRGLLGSVGWGTNGSACQACSTRRPTAI